MNKFLILFFFLISIAFNSYGEIIERSDSIIKKNSIHFDFGYTLFIGETSLNYERLIFQTKPYKLSVNAGFGAWYFVTISDFYSGYSIPISVNNIFGKGISHFETDIGVMCTVHVFEKISVNNRSPFYPILNFGYRYQRLNGTGLIFRTYFGTTGCGVSVGKAF